MLLPGSLPLSAYNVFKFQPDGTRMGTFWGATATILGEPGPLCSPRLAHTRSPCCVFDAPGAQGTIH